MRLVEAGYFSSLLAGRSGRDTNSPPQFGQIPPSTVSTQVAQNVHSKVQILASNDSGGKSLLQHSQFGRNSSIIFFKIDALRGNIHAGHRTVLYFKPTRTTGGRFANSSSEYNRPLVINAKPVPQSNENEPLEFGVASKIVCMFSAKVKWLLPM